MGATETDWFCYLEPPFGFYPPDSGSLEELEKRLLLDNDPDIGLSLPGFHGGDFLPGFEISSPTARIVPVVPPSIAPIAPVDDPVCASPPFNANKNSGARSRGNPPPRMTRKLSVSEELNSLSLEHLSKQVGAGNPSPTTPPTTPHSNKRASNSPLSSPKKQQLHHPSPSMVDSKEGILGSLFGADDFSAMGLVFGGIGDVGAARNSAMHRSLSSHTLGQLPGSGSHSSALDSTIQGLQTCSGSIVSSLSQLLEVKEGDGLEIDVKNQTPSPPSGFSSSIRRVCSAGDIQRMNSLQASADGQEDGSAFKIGRYSLAERKERIQRYRQKRSERNFNKKIKYACRKTLADSRPRVRGRFARNEDVVEVSSFSPYPHRQNRFKVDGENEDEADVLLEDDERFLIDRQSSGELSECWGLPLDGR